MRRSLLRCVPVFLLVAGSLTPVVAATTSVPAGAAAPYTAVRTVRVLDTRTGVGAPKRAVRARAAVTTRLLGRGHVPTSGVASVRLTVYVRGATAAGSVVAFPTGGTRKGAPTVTFRRGQAVQRTVTVRTGRGGAVSFANTSARPVHVVADVRGWTRAVVKRTPVRNLVAKPTGRSVTLTWANPAGDLPERHIVRRAAGPRPPATPTSGAPVATVPGSARLAVDRNLATDTLYSYSVFASYGGSDIAVASTTVETLGSGAVSGTVTGPSGEPVAGVKVLLWFPNDTHRAARTSGVTGADGRYVVDGLYPHFPYDVCFDTAAVNAAGDGGPTGLARQCGGREWVGQSGRPSQQETVTVDVGEVRNGVDARLIAGGAVSGTVRDAAGGPVPGSIVAVYGDGDGEPVEVARATTDAAGHYRATGLSSTDPARAELPGYILCAQNPSGARVKYLETCWPNVPMSLPGNAPGADRVQIQAGATSRANISVRRGSDLIGRVTDSAGQPVAGVTVSGHQEHAQPRARTDSEGRFRLGPLRTGRAGVCFDSATVAADRAPTGYLAVCRELMVGADGGSLADVRLTDAAGLAGYVRSSVSGAPVAGVRVYDQQNGYFGGVVTDANGHYVLRGLVPSRDPVTVTFDPSGAIGGGAAGYRTNERSGVVLTAGRSAVLDGTIDPAAAMTGRVLGDDGGPVSGVGVLIGRPAGATAPDDDTITAVTTGADGTWAARDLPPGTYSVCAALSPSTAVRTTTGWVGRCLGDADEYVAWATPQGTRYEVPPGVPVATGDLVLSAAAAISGIVTFENRPMAGVSVWAYGKGFVLGREGIGETDSAGRFVARNLGTRTDVTVCFDPPRDESGAGVGGSRMLCWRDTPWASPYPERSPDGATRFDLAPAEVVGGIDQDLAPR